MYVLTRTSGRPRAFGRLRADLLAQTYPNIVHVVHADDPTDTYIEADHIITGPRIPVSYLDWGPDIYHRRLLNHLAGLPPGWVFFIDDDDTFSTTASVESMMRAAKTAGPDKLVVWRIRRANFEKPRVWPPDSLRKKRGRLQWSNGAFHTNHLALASACFQSDHPIQKPFRRGSYDALFWLRMSHSLPIYWHDELLARQQTPGIAGKGYWKREDA